MNDFSGTKVALINKGKILTILRDDKPGIDFPGLWDLPGGAREPGESPLAVARREITEELGIDLAEAKPVWQKIYPAVADPNKIAHFIVIPLSDRQLDLAKLGDEGIEWKMVAFDEFLSNQQTVSGMQTRLKDYLVYANLLR